ENRSDAIARPPTSGEVTTDVVFRGLTYAFAVLTLLLVLFLVVQIAWVGWPAMHKYGFDFLKGRVWDGKIFGILPEIWGTLYSSIVGVGLGTVFGLAIAIFLSEDFVPPRLELVFKNIIELLAAIPSVVYGLWGIFVVIPAIRPLCLWLHENMGWV